MTPCHDLSGAIARLGGPLVVVDVGAQALAHETHVYEPLRRLGVPLFVVGFEPLADRAAARRALDGDQSMIIEAFIGDGGTHSFHPCSSSPSSSMFRLDPAACGAVASLARLEDSPGDPVATQRLDDLLDGLAFVDFLKLDIEGAELMALRGAVAVLLRTAVVHAETAFAAFREGQPLFADVDGHLRAHGFGLMRLHGAAMRAATTPSGAAGADRLMWADAVYFAEEATASDRALLVQAIIAGGVYGMHTVAERALAIYDRRHATGLACAYVRPEAPPAPWTPTPTMARWAKAHTNAVLRDDAAIEEAVTMMAAIGLPAHPDRPKNWDGLLATLNAVTHAPRGTPVLDAGAERYSTFLPGLRRLGFEHLVGINTAFDAAEDMHGVRLCPGDITGSDLAAAQFGFIACLSVIEHGVDLPAFFREQARLLTPGGHLFVSCDYWETPIDTTGLTAYGVPVRIFTRADLEQAIAQAADVGLLLTDPASLDCSKKVVSWARFGLRYTFATLMWRRAQG